jgi:hypothetical protein
MCCRCDTAYLHAYGILVIRNKISSLSGSILNTLQREGTIGQEANKSKDREVVIGSEVLHNDQLAVTPKQYQQGGDKDEEAQDAGELRRSIFSRHGRRQKCGVEKGRTQNRLRKGDGYVVCQTFCVSFP